MEKLVKKLVVLTILMLLFTVRSYAQIIGVEFETFSNDGDVIYMDTGKAPTGYYTAGYSLTMWSELWCTEDYPQELFHDCIAGIQGGTGPYRGYLTVGNAYNTQKAAAIKGGYFPCLGFRWYFLKVVYRNPLSMATITKYVASSDSPEYPFL